MKEFRDRVAAITGAGSGIGRALALELGSRGCHLALSDQAPEGLARLARELENTGVDVQTAVVDVADRDGVEQWAQRSAAYFGRVHMIFNNAGFSLSSTVEAVDYSQLERIVDVNFWGVVYGTKAFLPHLKRAGEGQVVNISSVLGLFSYPGLGPYVATKSAVRGWTEALRQELDMEDVGVSATCVHPGGIRTNIARAGIVDDSIHRLIGQDNETSITNFERTLITTPERAARTILRAVAKNRRRVLVGPDAVVLDLLHRLLGSQFQPFVTWLLRRSVTRRAPA